jgi:next-to-BRCA1 protein 1
MNLSVLRAKIATAFKFGPDADFVLTYTDEDGDAVMLDDDDDLRDAALRQKLNPLRITVELRKSQPTEQKEINSTPEKPAAQDPLSQIMSAIEGLKPAQEESLAHLKSAIGEAIKSIPEPIPDALAKLSHEVLAAAPPPLAELMKPFVQMMAPSNVGNGLARAEESSTSSTSVAEDVPVAVPAKAKPKAKACLDLRSVLKDAPIAAPSGAEASQGQQPSMYPSVEELLFPSNSVDKPVCKGKIDAQSKGKSVMSSATQPASPHAVPIHVPPPPLPCGFRPRRSQSICPWDLENTTKVSSDSRWRVPMHKVPYAPPAAVSHAPPGYGPSPHFPYPGRLLSSGYPYGDVTGSMESSTSRSIHRWIQCDGCGVQPIVGPRFKSNV